MAIVVWFCCRDKPSETKFMSRQEIEYIETKTTAKGSLLEGKKMSFGSVLRTPLMWQLFFIWFTFQIPLWGFNTWIPTYLLQSRHLSMKTMGIYASFPYFAGFCGLIVGGNIKGPFVQVNRKYIVILLQLIATVCLYLTYSANATNFVVWMTLTGFLFNMANMVLTGFPLTLLPPEVMGAGSGFYNTAGQIAGFIAPTLIGVLVQTSGGSYTVAFTTLVIFMLISAGITFSVRRRPQDAMIGELRAT